MIILFPCMTTAACIDPYHFACLAEGLPDLVRSRAGDKNSRYVLSWYFRPAGTAQGFQVTQEVVPGTNFASAKISFEGFWK